MLAVGRAGGLSSFVCTEKWSEIRHAVKAPRFTRISRSFGASDSHFFGGEQARAQGLHYSIWPDRMWV